MARKRYNIKWRESDEAKLKRAVKNYNAKIRRLEAKLPALQKERNARVLLPSKISYKELKADIRTRADFNRELKSLMRFTARGGEKLMKIPGNEAGVNITRWEYRRAKRLERLWNKMSEERKARLASLPAKQFGKPLGYTVGERQASVGVLMGQTSTVDLKGINVFTPGQTASEVVKKIQAIETRTKWDYFNERDQAYKENYLASLRANMSGYADDVIEYVENMSLREFVEVMYSEDENVVFDLSYPTTEEIENNANRLREIFGIEEEE